MGAYAQLTGNLGQDVELKQTNSGTLVVNLSLASNRTRKDERGERANVADWFRVTVFGRDAEVLAKYAHKGSALSFNGRLQNDSYVDREGVQRTTTVLIADSFEFMPSNKRKEQDADAVVTRSATRTNRAKEGMRTTKVNESDIPF